MFRYLCEAGDFVRRIRAQLRCGEFSRARLQLLRLEVQTDAAECEWIARPADPWDATLPASMRERNRAQQALADAMKVRDLLFYLFPDVVTANIRVYREGGPRELIIAGTVTRDEPFFLGIRSLPMRVKLSGLRFRLDNGKLEPLPQEGAL